MNNTIDGWIPGPQHRFDRYGQQRSWVRVKPPDKADKADNEDRQLDLTDFTDCKDPDCPF